MRVMILNLERREDRYWCVIGALSTLEFNVYDDVQRFLTHDGIAYKDTKAVHEAAIADGFEEFSEWRANYRAEAAWFWSYRCALRQIAEMDESVLLLTDDYAPKNNWTADRLWWLVHECFQADPDHGFRILQLNYSASVAHRVDHTPATSNLAIGLAGYSDYALILNAEGAQLVLDTMRTHPGASPEETYHILRCEQANPEIYLGLWHTIDPICRKLYEFSSDNWSTAGRRTPEPWEI